MNRLFDDTDDDVTLQTRRAQAAEERMRSRSPERPPMDLDDHVADREVTLNTGTVLALFFALALICAVFFGFGYSMGRKSAQPAVASSSDSNGAVAPITDGTATGTTTGTSTAMSTKPGAGSPAIQAIPGYMSQAEANTANEKAGAQNYKPAATSAPVTTASAAPAPERPAVKPVVIAPVSTPPAPVVRTPPAPTTGAITNFTPTTTPPAPGATYVQIAAVSHQEDANVLLSALQRRGYKVLERNDPADRLIHVQIGPFGNRKDAEATRQKLLGDGYNAFLK